MPKQTTGEFLATLRKANGFTQADVAEKLNISNRTLSSWETDRTMPDVLILPAIADLYGVTVDEILRGERAQGSADDKADLSENATKNMRKRKYGAFSSKYSILSGVAYACSGLLILTGILYLYSSSPLWLDILLTILGVGGIVTCIALCYYFANGVQVSEGIVLSDDVTEENKAFVFALKHKCTVLAARLSIPFLIFYAVISLVFLMVNPTDVTLDMNLVTVTVHIRQAYVAVMIVNALFALALFTFYFVCEILNFKKFAADKQREKYVLNKKLVKRILLAGGIPVLVILIVGMCVAPITIFGIDNIIYQCDDFEEFKTHMQTFVVTETDTIHFQDGAPIGEYELDFPEDFKYGTTYELGYGFYGYVVSIHSNIDAAVRENTWTISYDNNNFYSYEIFTFKVASGGTLKNVVNARYKKPNMYVYDYGIGISYTRTYLMNTAEDSYSYYSHVVYDISTFTMIVCVLAPLFSIGIYTTVYLTKRKKQNFNF